MELKEIISVIKRNNHDKKYAITLISDFLAINKTEAQKIYEEEFGK